MLNQTNLAPLLSHSIAAGFPSPADDHLDRNLDLNELCIKHPSATFFVRVSGLSMRDAGIFPEDILIVDRSLEPKSGKVVIAVVDNDFTVKRLRHKRDGWWLYPEHPDFRPIKLKQHDSIWGIVTSVIHLL